jgi:hypothetical protein
MQGSRGLPAVNRHKYGHLGRGRLLAPADALLGQLRCRGQVWSPARIPSAFIATALPYSSATCPVALRECIRRCRFAQRSLPIRCKARGGTQGPCAPSRSVGRCTPAGTARRPARATGAPGHRRRPPLGPPKVIAQWRNRIEASFGEITEQMGLTRHGAHTFWGLLTRTAATIAAHTLMRVCLAAA